MKNIKNRIMLHFYIIILGVNSFILSNGSIVDMATYSNPIVDIAILEKSIFDENMPVDYDAENDYKFDERNYRHKNVNMQPQLINYQNKQGTTLLMMLAAQENPKKIIKFAFEELLTNPNLQDKKGRTALHYAVSSGNLLIVKLLLEYRAKLDMQDYEGITPLYLAVDGNFVEIANILLQQGAQRNLGVFETGALPTDRIRTAAMKDVFIKNPVVKKIG